MFRLKWLLPVLSVAIIVVVAVVLLLPPRVTVNAQGIVAISNTTIPQFDIAKISDIPAYGVIEKSGCGEFKGKVKIRIDCFLTPDSPYYSQYGGAYVPVIPPEGYQGKVDEKTGEPLDWDDYNHWWDGLPTVWQDNPFHSHFVYYDTTVLDDTIKAEIAKVTEYFYAFHTYCWDNELTFLSQWVKVPKQVGTIRDVFIAGDSSPPNKDACEAKADDVLTRLPDFDTRTFEQGGVPPTDLNIGEKGTIDVGADCINRGSISQVGDYYGGNRTLIDYNNPANATGTIDTVTVWFNNADSDNSNKVGTFTDNGSASFTCHDAESIGEVDSGENSPITGLTIDISTGEYIGIDSRENEDTYIEKDTSGFLGVYYKVGQFCDPDDTETYSLYADDAISLYGTGTESGGDPDISNDPATWAIGTVATSTDYWSSGSEPSWPLDDGECHYTVTNNGDACSITVKGTNFTGGVGWTLAGSPAENTVTMKAGKSGDANEGAFITLTTSEQSFISGLAGSGTKKWELMMESSTGHTDGVAKEATITLTATLD